ncbi:DUF4258 domain-containing protein [Candidatus Woesearchaeota archaeon]|nr:DUF4258 domain-containing protein [Candidatus Woesearchaeota archaeon]
MNLALALHAQERMVEKGITRQQVIGTIKRGSKVVQTDGFLASFGYVKVAYAVKGDNYIVKTVMLR